MTFELCLGPSCRYKGRRQPTFLVVGLPSSNIFAHGTTARKRRVNISTHQVDAIAQSDDQGMQTGHLATECLTKQSGSLGARFRLARETDDSTPNFNGTFVFPSLPSFQITEKGLEKGLTPAQIRAAGIQTDGKIVLAGYATHPGVNTTDFALARYNPDGNLDPNFGSGGKVTTVFFGNENTARSVAIQPDGKLVVAGNTFQVGSPATGDSLKITFFRKKDVVNKHLGIAIVKRKPTALDLHHDAVALQKTVVVAMQIKIVYSFT
jgi:uncharacterized delta-60 repeat protein